MYHRQILIGSPTATLAIGANEDLTITVSEPGVLHLDTLNITAGQATSANTPSPDLTPGIAATSALVYGSIELIRGRDSVVVPAGAFSPYRGTNQIKLGDWPVQAGDTFVVNIASTVANSTAAAACMSCAFSPKSLRGGVAEPAGSSTYAGSPTSQLAAGNSGTATLTFDENGVFSLASLQMMTSLDLTAAAGAGVGQWLDGSAFAQISDIQLPNGNRILVGQNTPVMSAATFSAAHRSYSWADLGAIPVSASDTIDISWTNEGGQTANLSFGGRFYPRVPARPSRC